MYTKPNSPTTKILYLWNSPSSHKTIQSHFHNTYTTHTSITYNNKAAIKMLYASHLLIAVKTAEEEVEYYIQKKKLNQTAWVILEVFRFIIQNHTISIKNNHLLWQRPTAIKILKRKRSTCWFRFIVYFFPIQCCIVRTTIIVDKYEYDIEAPTMNILVKWLNGKVKKK